MLQSFGPAEAYKYFYAVLSTRNSMHGEQAPKQIRASVRMLQTIECRTVVARESTRA